MEEIELVAIGSPITWSVAHINLSIHANIKFPYGERNKDTGFLLPQNKKSREPLDKLCYSAEEVADKLGICLSTVWKLIRGGKIKAIVLGKRVLIRDTDLIEYIDSLPDYYIQDIS